MAVRDGMADLIAHLRVMVGDAMPGDPADAAFSDDDLQRFLDDRRTDVHEAALRAVPSTVGGSVVYVTFAAPRRWWESDATLSDVDGAALTLAADGADPLNGRWTLAAAVTTSVYVTGRYFDMYGTAAAVCESWASKVALEFDFATDQQRFDRTGKRRGLLAVAREFWRRAVKPGARPGWHSSDW